MKTFIQSSLLAMVFVSLLAGFTFTRNSSDRTLRSVPDAQDTAFVNAAADAGMLEVQLGKLAATKGSSAAVKEFGQSMVTDHTKANDELKALAGKKNIKVPAALSAKSQKKYEDVSKKSGADFDRAYADQMVKDHNEVIAKFKKESESGTDSDLKAWAKGKIPTLEHHLMMAQDMNKKVGTK